MSPNIKISSTLRIIFLLNLFVMSNSYASEEICSVLLSQGIHDRNSTFTTDQRFQQMYQLLSSSTFEQYNNAKSGSADLGINIIDMIDASLGGTTTENNYMQRRREFLNITHSTASSRYNYINKIEQVSASLVNAFTRCIETTRGFHTWVEP
ncbi:hypothetical protein RS130_07305 [Paraglaciecola aquimarina]|uniref:Uncharacterized protein n=1 Tax=Paraglaciecola aquimarina TaxID=1235557 RepID=A0ABU3SUS7_9ALTE|nr:hypothetical protein [Paraglaciecola aquimarina]MDU0353754.1 hypothetical protein [Paraglaciecola aquimarina]